jgi:hypothetical protein
VFSAFHGVIVFGLICDFESDSPQRCKVRREPIFFFPLRGRKEKSFSPYGIERFYQQPLPVETIELLP